LLQSEQSPSSARPFFEDTSEQKQIKLVCERQTFQEVEVVTFYSNNIIEEKATQSKPLLILSRRAMNCCERTDVWFNTVIPPSPTTLIMKLKQESLGIRMYYIDRYLNSGIGI